MPAASLAVLQEYESQMDAALASALAIFAAAPYSFTLYPQLSTVELVAPRVEYQFTLGEPAGPGSTAQQRAVATAARFPVSWNFTFRFLFITDRTKLSVGQSGYKGALRSLLLPPAPGSTGAFNATSLPYLEIAALNEVRAARGFVTGDEKVKMLDLWESNWDGIFTIRETAFPA